MSGPVLTVGKGVIAELVKTAAFEVPGVARVGYGGPSWRGWLAGPAVRVRVVNDESIHNHAAFAQVSWPARREPQP